MGLVLGSLISIKLHVPRVPRSVVARPRLLEELAWDGERRLTLLSAPAGFGKSILPGEWAVFQGREGHRGVVSRSLPARGHKRDRGRTPPPGHNRHRHTRLKRQGVASLAASPHRRVIMVPTMGRREGR